MTRRSFIVRVWNRCASTACNSRNSHPTLWAIVDIIIVLYCLTLIMIAVKPQ